jgi:hypothetical protein
MLSKCANPDCSAQFRYFNQGKLFRLETACGFERRRAMGENEPHKPLRRVEFYWLCQNCAGKMVLAYDKESGISVRPQAYARSAVA